MSTHLNLFTGPVITHLENNRVQPKGGGMRSIATHTCMTGGSYHLDATAQDLFYKIVGEALTHDRTGIPCVTEQHTTEFGMYIDFDGKFPIASLSDDAIERVVLILTQQARRFYPTTDDALWDQSLSTVLVMTKTGEPERDEEGRYKHGLHLHFPHLIVNTDQALQIRVGMISGLMRHTWTAEFGVERPDWDAVLDLSLIHI